MTDVTKSAAAATTAATPLSNDTNTNAIIVRFDSFYQRFEQNHVNMLKRAETLEKAMSLAGLTEGEVILAAIIFLFILGLCLCCIC